MEPDHRYIFGAQQPEMITAVHRRVKERTMILIILTDGFCMSWHPTSQTIVLICMQAELQIP